MAERSVPLTTIKGGINRLRTKGAALNDSLYDLLNGYVTAARTVKVRPGTYRIAELPSEINTDLSITSLTKGLCSFHGELHVFATEAVDVPEGFVLHVITRPGGGFDNAGNPIRLHKIHFAAPFMGFLYVVAEFDESDTLDDDLGNVFHYWLQTGEPWQADHIYGLGEIVTPTVPNGFVYQATRISPPAPSWAPNVSRSIGDVIEPTTYNGFAYTVVDTLGANPSSGAVEPVWPEEDGAQIIEEVDGTTGGGGAPPTTSQPNVATQPNPTTRNRYRQVLP